MKKTLSILAAAVLACGILAGCSSSNASSSSSAAASSSSASAAASASAASSSTAASASASASKGALADGTYEVDVTLSGGSGRASVSSPAKLVVSGGAMTATIEWSSNSFDKMVVNDVEYAPTNTEGNSTFDIPVSALDTDIAVSAETTAMSQPHMVDYTLHFDSKTVQAK
ncbi:MAG: hypothetical protein SOI38_02965 [Eggerthellaceae bacterium]|jgi:hypothetical protein